MDTQFQRYSKMLAYMRPAGSKTERIFIAIFIMPVLYDHADKFFFDKYGNLIARIYRKDGQKSKTLWSCHTDTVHNKEGRNDSIKFDTIINEFYQTGFNCLGADNTTGVWILLRLIEEGIPGTYIFHVEEELGTLGSGYISNNTPEIVKGHDFAIAFDRKGDSSIITRQSGIQTASDSFASQLAIWLGDRYYADPHGSFTDTIEYIDTIPECTNISCGFKDAHTKDESQSWNQMLDVVSKLLLYWDEDSLTPMRQPKAVSKYSGYFDQGYDSNFSMALTKDEIRSIVGAEPDVAVQMLFDKLVDIDDYYDSLDQVVPSWYEHKELL